MGGCCCCEFRRAVTDRAPVYFYCPQELEINEPLSASHITSAAIPTVLVDTNLDTSSPDTYRAPPAPLPYDIVISSQSVTTNTDNCSNKTDFILPAGPAVSHDEDLKASDCKSKNNYDNDSSKVKEDISKLNDAKSPTTDEEDVCPICLEDYDLENPRIITKCEHHFHLSCILEWMERSNTCPMCDQIMEINHACEE